MTFDELVIFYLKLINCSAKELTIESGLANGTISHYIHAQRKPTTNSPTVKMIANGIVAIGEKKNIVLGKDDIINHMYITSESDEPPEHFVFRKNMRRLLDHMGMSLNDLGSALNYDPSYMSRLLAGHRRPYNLEDIKRNTAKYFARYSSHDEDLICRLAAFYGCTPFEAGTDKKMADQTYRWISTDHGSKHSDTIIGELLDRINDFDMDGYRDFLHIDSVKLPMLPENRIIDKHYKHFSELKDAELDFIRNNEMTCSSGSITMYCDMPLNIEACDRSFVKNWAFGIYTLIERGITVNMIHDIYRPKHELLTELMYYIPLHMTGAVTPYCLWKRPDTPIMHLLHVSSTTAISGEAEYINEPIGSFHVTSDPEQLATYKSQADILMKKSKPLVRIYNKSKMDKYIRFMRRCPSVIASMISYSTVPIFVFSEDLLRSVLSQYSLSEEDIELIFRYRSHYRNEIENLPKNITIEILTPKIDLQPKYAKVTTLFLTDIFIENEIELTFEQYTRLIVELRKYADSMGNIKIIYSDKPNFEDLSACIIKDKLAIISKRTNPAIHLITEHHDIVNSIYDFFFD